MNEWLGVSEFIAVVEAQGFTAAARKLHVSPAHVSRSVQQLETRLGVKLLQRSTRVVKLTEAGESYYLSVQPLIQDLTQANQRVQDASNRLSGTIRVTAGGRYAEDHVAPVLADFCVLHDQVNLQLDLSTHMVDLIGQGFDLGIRYGQLPDSSLVARKLSVFPMLAVASPQYLDQYGEPSHPSELVDHRCVRVGEEPWVFYEDEQPIVVQPPTRWTTNTGGAAIAPVKQGLGIGYLPEIIVHDAIVCGSLVPILIGFKDLQRSSWLVYPNKAYKPTRVTALIDYLLKRFESNS